MESAVLASVFTHKVGEVGKEMLASVELHACLSLHFSSLFLFWSFLKKHLVVVVADIFQNGHLVIMRILSSYERKFTFIIYMPYFQTLRGLPIRQLMRVVKMYKPIHLNPGRLSKHLLKMKSKFKHSESYLLVDCKVN